MKSRGWFVVARFIVLIGMALVSSACLAQIDVEIMLWGPWSYVQDQRDPNRILVIAPYADHSLAVLPGDIANYGSVPPLARGVTYEVDLPAAGCGNHPPSSFYLYPANGVGNPNLGADYYAVSLPKPCYYESYLEDPFRYNGIRDVTGKDPARSFTTAMILHYKVTTNSAVMYNGASVKQINFAGNPPVIHIATYLDASFDTRCDSHSRHAFYLTESTWNLPHVHRVFPGSSSYDYTCEQSADPTPTDGPAPPSAAVATHDAVGPVVAHPGHGDCHSPQFNINGVVQ
jgi:hypothetical protein